MPDSAGVLIGSMPLAGGVSDSDHLVLARPEGTRRVSLAAMRDHVLARDGGLLWEWNGADVSQFDASPFPHRADTTTPGTVSSQSLEVVTDTVSGRPALRASATLTGGLIWAVREDELELPERYVVAYRVAAWGASGASGVCLAGSLGARVDAFGIYTTPGFGSATLHGIRAHEMRVSGGNITTATVNASLENAGGLAVYALVRRAAGETPVRWSVSAQAEGAVTQGTLAATQASVTAPAAEWAGRDMTRCGLAVYWGSSGTPTAVSVTLTDLRVYAWPGPRG